MARFFYMTVLGAAVCAAAACSKPPSTTAQPAHPVQNMSRPQLELGSIFERYWDERVPVEGVLAPQTLADALSVEKNFLAQALAVPHEHLDAATRLNFDIFVRQRVSRIQGFTYPAELLPINPFSGMPLEFAAAAAGFAQGAASTADYEAWLHGVDAYVAWTRQAAANLRDGTRRGYVQPRTLIERMLPLLAALASDDARNVFYTPSHSIPAALGGGDTASLRSRLNDAVASKLVPASRDLHEFLLHEYLPRARTGLSLSELPLGEAWYAYLVRRATGTNVTAGDVHRFGESEVQRLHARLLALRPAGEAAEHAEQALSADDLLRGYQELQTQVIAALPRLLGAGRQTAQPPAYQPPAAAALGSEPPVAAAPAFAPLAPYPIRAATYVQDPTVHVFSHARTIYIDPAAGAAQVDAASFLASAVPGVLYQADLQRKLDVPKFRRYSTEPVFVRGWALYAATLGEGLGVYPDDAAKYQAVALDMRCAVALVIDTGLHAQGWTRPQALDYLHAQMPLDDATAQAMIDKYAAMPGEALSCKWGAMRLTALRAKAEHLLGARFEENEFHARLLAAGAMPPDLLESQLEVWLAPDR